MRTGTGFEKYKNKKTQAFYAFYNLKVLIKITSNIEERLFF